MIVQYRIPPHVGQVVQQGVNTPVRVPRNAYNMGALLPPISPWNRELPRGSGMAGYVTDPTTGDTYYIDDETGEVTAYDGNTYGEQSWGDWFQSIFTGENVKTVLTAAQAYQLNQINLERAQRGLAPLSAAQYAPSVNVGVSADTQRMLLFGAIGLGAVLLLSRSGGGSDKARK